jgi:hypothetical protein
MEITSEREPVVLPTLCIKIITDHLDTKSFKHLMLYIALVDRPRFEDIKNYMIGCLYTNYPNLNQINQIYHNINAIITKKGYIKAYATIYAICNDIDGYYVHNSLCKMQKSIYTKYCYINYVTYINKLSDNDKLRHIFNVIPRRLQKAFVKNTFSLWGKEIAFSILS